MRSFQTMPYGTRQKSRNLICFKEEDITKQIAAGGDGSAGGDEPPKDEPAFDPNVDLTKQFTAPEPTAEEKQVAIDAAKAASDATAAAPVAGDSYLAFENLAKKYEGITLPTKEQVTAENMFDMFEETIKQNLDITSLLDPRVAAIQSALENKVPFEQAIANYIPSNQMTDEQKVTAYYKEKYELTDEKVVEFLKDANIKKEALEADMYFKRKQEFVNQQTELQNNAQRQAEMKQNKELWEKDITTTLGNFKNKTEVWGTKLTEADKTDFEKTYRNWVTAGENGEPAPIVALVHNDNFLADVIFLASKPGRVKDLLDSEKEELRTFYKKRLALEPEITRSNQGASDDGKINHDLLKRGAQD